MHLFPFEPDVYRLVILSLVRLPKLMDDELLRLLCAVVK